MVTGRTQPTHAWKLSRACGRANGMIVSSNRNGPWKAALHAHHAATAAAPRAAHNAQLDGRSARGCAAARRVSCFFSTFLFFMGPDASKVIFQNCDPLRQRDVVVAEVRDDHGETE